MSTHPGLNFGGVGGVGGGGLRRGGPFASPNPPSKPSQHGSPYQQQSAPYQPPHQASYPQHLFSTSSSTQIANAGVQNGVRPSQQQVAPTLPGPRRAPPPRQMTQPTASLSYLQQSLNQPSMNQQNMNAHNQQSLGQQPITQQALNQQMSQQQSLGSQMNQSRNQQSLGQQYIGQQNLGPQSLNQTSMGQQQSLGPATLSHPSLSQPPVTQALGQQSMSQPIQPIDGATYSQRSTPHPPSQPTPPPVGAQKPQSQQMQQAQQSQPQQNHQIHQPHQMPQHPQMPQVQQMQQVQQSQPVPLPQLPPQIQPLQSQAHHSTPSQADHTLPVPEDHNDDDIDMTLQDEEGDSALEPRLVDNNYVPRDPMGPLMSAPPEGGSFPSLDAVHKHAMDYCTSVGYAIVIGRSKKTVPGLKKVLFVCDRAGKPPRRVDPEQRKRKTSSRKCDCQFGFFAIEQRTQWTIRYRPAPEHLKHNHGPSESAKVHPAARKLDKEMVARVKALKESGVGVSQTLDILQQDNPHVPLLPRDIYNARAAINRNPAKVAAALAENKPAIYNKPHPSTEDKIRADLRKEIARHREEHETLKMTTAREIENIKKAAARELENLKAVHARELEELKKQSREKDKQIEKYEMFIDICNERVMFRRERLERLTDGNEPNARGSGSAL